MDFKQRMGISVGIIIVSTICIAIIWAVILIMCSLAIVRKEYYGIDYSKNTQKL